MGRQLLEGSFRVGVGCFDETGLPSVVFGRGVYGHSVIEAWDWRDGKLTRRWRFDTNDGRKGKDGKRHSTYASQGNHSLNVADLDGDGLDEVMYGSMAVDDDGFGLWNTQLGHGDANHVGKFLPDREGLQMFHCLETGKTMVALHDARDGKVIWKKDGSSDNDMGRCMVADLSPATPGCEFYYYKSDLFDQNGNATNISTSKDWKLGFAAGVWFDGSLSRQGLNEEGIVHSVPNGRTFTMWRYSMSMINGTKGNPSWYGDLVGDWREEIILPDATKLVDLKIFSTWYPTTHKFPWLMTDHCYWMSALNQNIGYNQPTNLGYYLGSDIKNDADAWAEAEKVQNRNIVTGIRSVTTTTRKADDGCYNLMGQKVSPTKRLLTRASPPPTPPPKRRGLLNDSFLYLSTPSINEASWRGRSAWRDAPNRSSLASPAAARGRRCGDLTHGTRPPTPPSGTTHGRANSPVPAAHRPTRGLWPQSCEWYSSTRAAPVADSQPPRTSRQAAGPAAPSHADSSPGEWLEGPDEPLRPAAGHSYSRHPSPGCICKHKHNT